MVVLTLIRFILYLGKELFFLTYGLLNSCWILILFFRLFRFLDLLYVEVLALSQSNTFEIEFNRFNYGEEFSDNMGVLTDLGKNEEFTDELDLPQTLNHLNGFVVFGHQFYIINMTSLTPI